MKYRAYILIVILMCFTGYLHAQTYKMENNISYRPSTDDSYARERCVLDIYYPEGKDGFSTLVWFHGGGLEGGEKQISSVLKNRGICVVAVSYRLSPKAQHPAYIEDAAAALAWVVDNIARYGGDPSKIYVSGHSAGGYLVSMIGLDKSYLDPYGIDPDSLAGFMPISGQTVTHYTVRKEMGISQEIPYIDKYAPLMHIRKNTAPFLIIVGDAALEMKCRTAENFYLYEALKSVGNNRVEYHELSGFNHGGACDAGLLLVLRRMGAK